MSGARVSQDRTLRERAIARRAQFEHEGISIAEWSRRNGFKPTAVANVLTGERPCRFGVSHRIAVALGIKEGAIVASAAADPAREVRP